MQDRDTDHTSSPPPGGGEVRVVIRKTDDARGKRSVLLYKALALMMAFACVGYFAMPQKAASNADIRADAADNAIAGESSGGDMRLAASETVRVSARERAPEAPVDLGRDLQRDLSEFYVPGQPVPSMKDVIARLNEAGIHSGIGAFNPPGTSPPLVGLAVPVDFPLPEGYVRHHQATDDGQSIEAILMFSPDFEFFDASGRPIAIPENRVVPPNMAPPGLPIRSIRIPPPLDPHGTP
jgi:hypothetical protein